MVSLRNDGGRLCSRRSQTAAQRWSSDPHLSQGGLWCHDEERHSHPQPGDKRPISQSFNPPQPSWQSPGRVRVAWKGGCPFVSSTESGGAREETGDEKVGLIVHLRRRGRGQDWPHAKKYAKKYWRGEVSVSVCGSLSPMMEGNGLSAWGSGA